MSRPRLHGEETAASLLDAAERLVADSGPGALSVRSVARAADTTTRAVYSLFESRDGLLAALGARAFDLLGAGLAAWPWTRRPDRDLVSIALGVFRQTLVLDHPVLFELGIQRPPGEPAQRGVVYAAALRAWPHLLARFQPLQVPPARRQDAATAYHAMCEGLGALELRRALLSQDPSVVWRRSFEALLSGLGSQTTD
jgi:AcrR family transcriptional regulator